MNEYKVSDDWIPYLKFNYICHKMGYVIDWSAMKNIKNNIKAYKQPNSDVTAFIFDFHCGAKNKKTINGNILIDNIYYSTADPSNYKARHRCLDKEWLCLTGKSKYNNCGSQDRPLITNSVHPCFLVKGEKIRVEQCGFDFCFEDDFNIFLDELCDYANNLVIKVTKSQEIKHVDLALINWKTFDISDHSLAVFLLKEKTKRERLKRRLNFILSSNKNRKRETTTNATNLPEANTIIDDNTSDHPSDEDIMNDNPTLLPTLLPTQPIFNSNNENISANMSNLSSPNIPTDMPIPNTCSSGTFIPPIAEVIASVSSNMNSPSSSTIPPSTNTEISSKSNANSSIPTNVNISNIAEQIGQLQFEINTEQQQQQSRTESRKTKPTKSWQPIVNSFQSELFQYVDVNLRTLRAKIQIEKICLKYGKTYQNALSHMHHMKYHGLKKKWNTIKIPTVNINIYEDEDEEEIKYEKGLDFVKLFLARREALGLNEINISYTPLDILKYLRNE
eukprot:172358_1